MKNTLLLIKAGLELLEIKLNKIYDDITVKSLDIFNPEIARSSKDYALLFLFETICVCWFILEFAFRHDLRKI